MFVGDGHEHLAEGPARIERAYPALLRRGLLGSRPLQAAAGPLDQQGAQVGVAAN